jgi:cytochrome c oxidase cbb3-type subunit III
MQHIRSIKKIGLTILTALLATSAAIAQDAAPAAKTVVSNNNQLETLLIVIMGLLVFVIWLLGRVLLVLGKQVVEKNKVPKVLPALLMAALLFAAQTTSAQNAAPAETVKVISNYGGLSSGTFYLLLSVLATEIIIILFFTSQIRRFSAELLPEKKRAAAPAKANKLKLWWSAIDKKIFTKAIPVEREQDIMLDHNYDGIRELDNALPPWWKYGFYITIGVAVVYLLNFHVFGYGKNPTQEYQAEMEQAKIQKEIYEANNKDKIDENNVPYADAAGLAKAKDIFTTTCFACHGKLGEGGAGPNLTDNYWLHKGSLNDIYQSIKHGYPDKGMQAWSAVYTPKEISLLASYVKSLHGSNPANPKAPQGDLYADASNSQAGAASDSSTTNVTKVKQTMPVVSTPN